MKHIKKKYQFESQNLPAKKGATITTANRSDSSALKEVGQDTVPFLQTTDGANIWGMHYNHNGIQTIIPLPDLTLVYFDFGYACNKIREDYNIKLFIKLTSQEELTEEVSSELYHYFGAASSCIIGMFNALEAFINNIIPDGFIYDKKGKQKKEYYNKDRIQKEIKFDEKLKLVLPKATKFKYDLSSSLIINLKNLRDEIVHTKSKLDFNTQENLIKGMLDFNYEKCMNDIRDFINFYRPNFIENCDCGNDF